MQPLPETTKLVVMDFQIPLSLGNLALISFSATYHIHVKIVPVDYKPWKILTKPLYLDPCYI